jgi:hypothetical protein
MSFIQAASNPAGNVFHTFMKKHTRTSGRDSCHIPFVFVVARHSFSAIPSSPTAAGSAGSAASAMPRGWQKICVTQGLDQQVGNGMVQVARVDGQ